MEHLFPSTLSTRDQGRHSRYPNTKYNDFIITGLRTMWGIRLADIRERFGKEKQAYFERQAATYLRQGLLIRENDTLTLSKEGIFISDGIMSDLLWV